MRVYSYTPQVFVYIATLSGKYYDVSDDIVTCSVSRKSSAVSDFGIDLQNKQAKYNGVFSPMDKVTIFASKDGKKVRLLTGYITTVDRFTLYEQNFHIQGKCSLYQLERMYWDPQLYESQKLASRADDVYTDVDAGLMTLVERLLGNVGGWNTATMFVHNEIPDAVIQWAQSMYEADKKEYQGMYDMAQEFYELLRTTGPEVAGSLGGGEMWNGVLTDAQKDVLRVAKNANSYNIPAPAGYCAMWVADVYQAAGHPSARNNAVDLWEAYKGTGSTSRNGIPPGAAVFGSGSGSGGAQYGHIGIYLDNGGVADNSSGYTLWDSIDSWVSWQHALCRGKYQGWIGWAWIGVDLTA